MYKNYIKGDIMKNISVSMCCCVCGKPAQHLKDMSKNGSMDIRYYCEKCMKNINNEVD
jgi:predicted amidophosphoribosyltransferase